MSNDEQLAAEREKNKQADIELDHSKPASESEQVKRIADFAAEVIDKAKDLQSQLNDANEQLRLYSIRIVEGAKQLAAERKISETRLAVIKDDCETDTNVRELARPILGDIKVDGDSYGVPGLEDIIEELIKQLAAERDKVQTLVDLCDEVAASHRDKDSPDYNECDESPCAWCDALAKVKKQESLQECLEQGKGGPPVQLPMINEDPIIELK
jgi:hypothetical protein